MADKLDLNGDIATAVDSAPSRGRSLVLGYVDEEGNASVSFRGSAYVPGSQQLAMWARQADEGFAKAIASHPQLTLLYSSPDGAPAPRYLSFAGRAHVDPSAN